MQLEIPKTKDKVNLRAIRETDEPFIWNSWLNSFRHSKAVYGQRTGYYMERQKPIIQDLLDRCSGLVITDIHDDDHLYGYVIYEQLNDKLIIHYIYLKEFARRFGIATKLLQTLMEMHQNCGMWFSHFPPNSKIYSRLQSKFNIEYNPDLINGERDGDRKHPGNDSRGMGTGFDQHRKNGDTNIH